MSPCRALAQLAFVAFAVSFVACQTRLSGDAISLIGDLVSGVGDAVAVVGVPIPLFIVRLVGSVMGSSRNSTRT